jgi:PhnB protein
MTEKLVPYLNFDGDCRAAMEFYQGVFGGDLSVQTYGQSYQEASEGIRDRVIHARLEANAVDLMASDTHPEHGPPYVAGNSVHLSLIGADHDTLADWFEQLADGGSIDMPLEKQFWGDVFGMLTDRFGMHWMVSISPTQ